MYSAIRLAGAQIFVFVHSFAPLKAMSIQIKGITSRLRTSYVIITFPLKCGICLQMVSVTARHKVAGQNAVQLCNRPLSALFVWNCQFNCHGFSKILGKFSS